MKTEKIFITIMMVLIIGSIVFAYSILRAEEWSGYGGSMTLELRNERLSDTNYGSIGDSITVDELIEYQHRIDEENRCPYSIGDKFKTNGDLVFTLESRIEIYDPNDDCLRKQRQGYAIMCYPELIGYRWSVVFDLNGVNVNGWVGEEDLADMEQITKPEQPIGQGFIDALDHWIEKVEE